MTKTKKRQPGDGFARFFHLAEDTLRAMHAPGWWDTLYRILARWSDYDNGLFEGSINAIQKELRARRIHKSDGAIRHALRRFQAIGLLGRDHEVNMRTRRIKAVIRRGASQSIEQLKNSVMTLIGRLAAGTITRAIHRPVDRSASQGYQNCGSDSIEKPKSTAEGRKQGLQHIAALNQRWGRTPKTA